MTCSHCSKEYDSSVLACPECGRTLTYGADTDATVKTVAPPPAPGAFPRFDLSSTVSVSGSASIRSRLRPRTVWEIIGEAFSLYWQNWKVFLPVALILYAPIFLAEFFFQRSVQSAPASPGQMLTHAGPILAYVYTLVIFSWIITFVLTRGVSNCYLNKPISVLEMLKLNNRFWGFLGAILLAGLVQLVAVIILSIPFFVVVFPHIIHHETGNPAVFLGLFLFGFADAVLCFILVFALSVVFMVVPPAAVVEGRGAIDSVRRGVTLIRGFFWKGAGLFILAMLIVSAIQQVFSMVSMCFTLPEIFVHVASAASIHSHVNPMASLPAWVWAAQAGLLWLGSSLSIPVMMLMTVLFYYDLRIRKEAFDLQMLSEQLGYGVENAA